ncbi:hypothetical protein [Streptomyces lasiicapitis]|uniref:hypothetical protein n=1 Tax=Streptomyces lasiicapitis TaxID=1923961 RepID=UPI0036BD6DBB
MPEEAVPEVVGSPHGAARRRTYRYRGLTVAVGIGLVLGVAGGIAAHAVWPDESPATDKPPAAAGTVASEAETIRAAMLKQKRVGVGVLAREGGDPDFFTGRARLELRDATTAHAETHVLYDMGEGHAWYPPEIVLIGNRAAITPAKEMTGPAYGRDGAFRTVSDATAASTDDVPLHNALEARWLAEPAHLVALLDGATRVSTRRAGAGDTRTLTGSTPLRVLGTDAVVGRLYRPYAAANPGGTVRFTLTVNSRDLPGTLKTEVPSRPDGDIFSVEYRRWGKGAPITRLPGAAQ